jgi:hypothetical protein
MHENYFKEEKNNRGNSLGRGKWYEFSEYPFAYGSYMILKKNGILANSFDIETRYPYLDNEFVSICAPLGEENGKKKRVHVENCRKHLPSEVVANMSKIGGSTDCHSLFENREEMRKLIRFVEQSEFYHSHRVVIKKMSYAEKNKPKAYEALRTWVRDTLYKALRKETPTGDYYGEEMKLREYLCCAYLILFEKLFVSKLYDNAMKDVELSVPLNDFFE